MSTVQIFDIMSKDGQAAVRSRNASVSSLSASSINSSLNNATSLQPEVGYTVLERHHSPTLSSSRTDPANAPENKSNSDGQNTTNQKQLRTLLRHWWLEFLAVISLMMILNTMILILHQSQSKPIHRWPLHVGLNTVISVLGAGFRVPLLFLAAEGLGQLKWHWMFRKRPLHHLTVYDQATRGPWGSLKLLWMTRGRHITTTIGATITIGAIALDPFTQAVIGFNDCPIQDGSLRSTIARVNTFGYYEATTSSSLGMPIALERAIVAGIAAPGDISVAYSCPTGNCTFPSPYSSIGYCSACNDITNRIEQDCPDRVTNCRFTLPSAKLFVGTYPDGDGHAILNVGSEASDWLTGQGATNAPYMSTLEFPITILARTARHGENHSAIASTCTLRPCVKTYTATVKGGIMTESVVNSTLFKQNYTNMEVGWWFPWVDSPGNETELITQLIKVGCLSEVEKIALSKRIIDFEADKEWISWQKESLNDSLPIAPRCVYQFQTAFHGILESFLVTYFNGSTGNDTASAGYTLEQSPFDVLSNDKNISFNSIQATFASIAESITNTIRSPTASLIYVKESEANDTNYQYRDITPVEGETMRNTSCVVVLWPWMVLPAALTVAAVIFIVLLIINDIGETRSGVWKTSQVALLWHGLDGPAKDEGVNLTNVKDMNRRAKELQVRLRNTDSGWKLSQEK